MLILKLCIGHTSAGDSDRLQAVEDDVLLSETAGTSGGGYEDQPPAYGSVRGTKSKFGSPFTDSFQDLYAFGHCTHLQDDLPALHCLKILGTSHRLER